MRTPGQPAQRKDTGGALPVPPSRYSREMLATFAGPDYEDFLAARGQKLRPRLARALELSGIQPGMRVLDLGCGRGEVTFHLLGLGANVVALDYSPDCLAMTREAIALAPGEAQGRAQLVLADATRLPFPNGSFDRVLILDLVEHLLPWQLHLAMVEVGQLLDREGRIVIHTLPNRWALKYGYPLLRLLRPSLPSDPRTDYERQLHVNEQSPVSLATVLRESGLACRVWVENLTVQQALWQSKARGFEDVRREAYPWVRRTPMRWLLALAMATPLKYLAANDIFAVAWRPSTHAKTQRCKERHLGGLAALREAHTRQDAKAQRDTPWRLCGFA